MEPIDPRTLLVDDQIFPAVAATQAFQRLKSIRFLGAIDYALVRSPNGAGGNVRYTRYQHSLGVARLAAAYSRMKNLSFSDRRLICLAALLHDIGHAPLSHSLEPAFRDAFNIEHHNATEDIIRGLEPIGSELHNLLKHHHICIDRVVDIIAGRDLGFDGFFAGPINFDTIEGILRCQAFVRPSLTIPNPEVVVAAAIRRVNDRDCNIVDEFWGYKDWVYRNVIGSRVGVLADYACQSAMRHHIANIGRSDYFGTEEQIFRKLPGLLNLLVSSSFERDVVRNLDVPIKFTQRRFYVDGKSDFSARDDNRRYRQKRCDGIIGLSSDVEWAKLEPK